MNPLMNMFVKTHVALYRMTGGKIGGSMRGGTVLVLTTTGKKTGLQRSVPLVYITDEAGNPVITASANGAPVDPAWFNNLKANPEITYQVGPKVVKARAEVANPEQRSKLWATLTAKHAGFLDYMKKTTRVIPMVTLKPA